MRRQVRGLDRPGRRGRVRRLFDRQLFEQWLLGWQRVEQWFFEQRLLGRQRVEQRFFERRLIERQLVGEPPRNVSVQ
jgi:hypothetical protein